MAHGGGTRKLGGQTILQRQVFGKKITVRKLEMTADEFQAFRSAYEARYGKLKDGEWAAMLGIGRDSMTRIKQRGVPLHSTVFRLAFAALWHNLNGYGEK